MAQTDPPVPGDDDTLRPVLRDLIRFSREQRDRSNGRAGYILFAVLLLSLAEGAGLVLLFLLASPHREGVAFGTIAAFAVVPIGLGIGIARRESGHATAHTLRSGQLVDVWLGTLLVSVPTAPETLRVAMECIALQRRDFMGDMLNKSVLDIPRFTAAK
jgi:hypothetical protein